MATGRQAQGMLSMPLTFRPTYQTVVWGGRRLARWRRDLPAGPIGESWDLADHPRGMSVVAGGPLAGMTLADLTRRFGSDLVGVGFAGGDFPLLVKTIDANDTLSVQVHPDDELAVHLGVGNRGKTECWYLLADGGHLFAGTVPGTTANGFAAAVTAGTVAESLNRYASHARDFFFLPARRVHALGAGCLIVEIQQTCDVTFRVFDWGRVGLDGKPRQLHIDQAMATIDFAPAECGPVMAAVVAHPAGGAVRKLADCTYFTVEERILTPGGRTRGEAAGACSIVMPIAGGGWLSTAAGGIELDLLRPALIPAIAGGWRLGAGHDGLRALVAQPRFVG